MNKVLAVMVGLILMVGCNDSIPRPNPYRCEVIGYEYNLTIPDATPLIRTEWDGYIEVVAIYPDTVVLGNVTNIPTGAYIEVTYRDVSIETEDSTDIGFSYIVVHATMVKVE